MKRRMNVPKLSFVILTFLHATFCAAQLKERLQARGEQIKNVADSVLDAHRKVTTDTLYVKRPDTPWTFRIKTDGYGNSFDIKGVFADGERMDVRIKADLKQTIGLTANYRGLSLALSLNPVKLFGKSNSQEYNINYYNNRWGADLSYSDIHDFSAIVKHGDHNLRFNLPDTRLWSASANMYYVFNGRRFSYPSAFNHSWIQRRSAGSLLAAATVYLGRLTSDYDDQTGFLALHKSIRMRHVSLGLGYGYNYVPDSHWLIHGSFQSSVMVLKKYEFAIMSDPSTGEAIDNTPTRIFPEIYGIGRLGITYSWNRYFIGTTGVVQTSKVGKDSEFSLQNTLWKCRTYFGIRL